MPLTFSHAAAALPLRRLRLPFSALVVGTMAPDFLYFTGMMAQGRFGHTLPGLFLSCLPLGLLLLWVFHRLIKRPLIGLAPLAAQQRLHPFREASPFDRPLALVAVALVLGACTHIVWDSFTHAERWGVAHVAWLRQTVPVPVLGTLSVYRLVQHGSTLFGLAVLALALLRWWRRAPVHAMQPPALPARTRACWLLGFGLVAVLAGLAYGMQATADARPVFAVFVGRFVVAWTSALFLSVLAYGCWQELGAATPRPTAAGAKRGDGEVRVNKRASG